LVYIFISHSRRDEKLVLNVQRILTNVGHIPILEEFIPEEEKLPIPHDEIKSKVDISQAIFLFLTDNVLATKYTENWVVFEVGLAKDQGKRVFVFERKGVPIPYPIPYVTDYMLFGPESIEDLLEVQTIAKDLTPRIPPGLGWGALGGLIGSMFGPLGAVIGAIGLGGVAEAAAAHPRRTMPVTCPYPNCGVIFDYHSPDMRSFLCPTCRQGIALTG